MVIKMVQYWYKDKQTNETEQSLAKNPLKYGHKKTYTKGLRAEIFITLKNWK